MWIGSPLRGAFRLLSYLLLTLAAAADSIWWPWLCASRRSCAGCRSLYHRVVCIILGIKVKRERPAFDRDADALRLQSRFLSRHRSAGRIDPGLLRRQGGSRDLAVLQHASQGAAHDLRRSAIEQDRQQPRRDAEAARHRRQSHAVPEGTSSDGTRVLPFRSALFAVAQLRRDDRPIVVQPVAISYTRLDGIPLGRYWRPLFAWFGDLDLVPHLWQMVCLGETEAVITFSRRLI